MIKNFPTTIGIIPNWKGTVAILTTVNVLKHLYFLNETLGIVLGKSSRREFLISPFLGQTVKTMHVATLGSVIVVPKV